MKTVVIDVPDKLLRGARRPRVALVGRQGTGKSTMFAAAASTVVAHERLAGVGPAYAECLVEVGLEQISLVDLPPLSSIHELREPDRVVLKYLLWGDHWPAIARHEARQPGARFAAPEVLILVVDATMLERDLELALLGRPLVVALNRIDEARAKGLYINARALAEQLGAPVVPTIAHMGVGLTALFAAAIEAAAALPRPLSEELHADRHHRAALLFEAATRVAKREETRRWQLWLDELFLHPRWGLIGSMAVFALVLTLVFEGAAALDALTSARLAAWVQQWQPASTAGVVGRAVADALVGLVGIVVPYMIPLVVLLVALEELGIMHRVAFVVDRGFHHVGLHGGVAVPFLIGLGCNVPALSAVAAGNSGRERVLASLLITFVPARRARRSSLPSAASISAASACSPSSC